MNTEDQKVQIKTPVNPVSQPESVVPPAVSAPSTEGLVASNQKFRVPEGLDVMQTVETPNLSGVAGTGAQEHPPAFSSIDGSGISLPDVDIGKLSEGSPYSGPADLARVKKRQLERRAA